MLPNGYRLEVEGGNVTLFHPNGWMITRSPAEAVTAAWHMRAVTLVRDVLGMTYPPEFFQAVRGFTGIAQGGVIKGLREHLPQAASLPDAVVWGLIKQCAESMGV
jgi:hypothetical protein